MIMLILTYKTIIIACKYIIIIHATGVEIGHIHYPNPPVNTSNLPGIMSGKSWVLDNTGGNFAHCYERKAVSVSLMVRRLKAGGTRLTGVNDTLTK